MSSPETSASQHTANAAPAPPPPKDKQEKKPPVKNEGNSNNKPGGGGAKGKGKPKNRNNQFENKDFEKRKRPEVQHYKPGAFRKQDGEEIANPDGSSDAPHANAKPEGKGDSKSSGKGGKGGSKQKQQQSNNDDKKLEKAISQEGKSSNQPRSRNNRKKNADAAKQPSSGKTEENHDPKKEERQESSAKSGKSVNKKRNKKPKDNQDIHDEKKGRGKSETKHQNGGNDEYHVKRGGDNHKGSARGGGHPQHSNRERLDSHGSKSRTHHDDSRQRGANEDNHFRGGRREFRRGGGRGGGAGRGEPRHHSSTRNKQSGSRKSSPTAEKEKPPLQAETLKEPIAQQQQPEIKTSTALTSQDARRDSSSPHRHQGPMIFRRSERGGGQHPVRGDRGVLSRDFTQDSGDWNQSHHRFFSRENSQGSERDNSHGRWVDDRRQPRNYHHQREPTKAPLPPRFQRQQQQQQPSTHRENLNHGRFEPPEPFRHNRIGDINHPWRGGNELKQHHQSVTVQRSLSPPPAGGDCHRSETPPKLTSERKRQDDSLVSDWSLEVEEEEERQELRRVSADREIKKPQAARGGGIIRLPHETRLDNNPAFRDVASDQAVMQQQPRGWGQQQQQRFLFDPKNPNRPIPHNSRHHGGEALRFPDPRFSGPQRMPLGPPIVGYRPPFSGGNSSFPPGPHPRQPMAVPQQPPTSAAGFPEWYDQRFFQIEKNAKHDRELLSFIMHSDLELRKIIRDGGGKLLCQLWHTDVAKYRKNIQQAFEHLLKSDLTFCEEKDVEFHIWKIAFYSLVEVLKGGLKEENPPEVRQTVERNIQELLDEGMEFYNSMLETLDDRYSLDLETYYDILEPRPEDKFLRCALMSAQKCLLCLGDLARYREMIRDTSNYGKARQYYQKASNIEPRNGRPFNQLAILARSNNRKFETVYYNMRCLQSQIPFPSSHESLRLVFDEIRRKWEAAERKRLEERADRHRLEGRTEIPKMEGKLRQEIWIKPDGGPRLHRMTSASSKEDDDEKELKAMSPTDLNRRFLNTFLYLIGKFYTRINLDSFPDAPELLRKEFRALVSRTPLPIDSKRLVQIMSLNMFVIEHTKLKQGGVPDPAVAAGYRTALQDAALSLAFDMFAVLVERCNSLLESFNPHVERSTQCLFPDEDITSLLAAVKIWCDWLLGNNETWFPPVNPEAFAQLAKLATHFERLKPPLKTVLASLIHTQDWNKRPDKQTGFELVKLEEDALLCGFNPWLRGLDWNEYRRYVPRSVPTALAQDAKRLDAINFCIDYLEGIEPPILKWSPPDGAHISLVEEPQLATPTPSEKQIEETYYSDDEDSTEQQQTMQTNFAGTDSNISRLKMRKDELQRMRQEESRRARKLERQFLNEQVRTTIEISPRYLVPDTNCFVSHLPQLQQLLSSGYQLRVPSIVLNELEGLGKGNAPAGKYSSTEHAAMVAENARQALGFLRESRPGIVCVTSRGTPLTSMAVTIEENSQRKNDDLILDSCMGLVASSGLQSTTHSGSGVRKIHRDVVLLTNDNNLRVKAHIADIPVNKLVDFVRWSSSSSQKK